MSSTASSCTALLLAVQNQDYIQTLKLLREHCLPIDDKWNDYKILIHAVNTGNTKIVKLLTSYGCRVRSSRSNSCKTPLCYAVNRYNLQMVKVLLEAGASITDKDCNVDTPLTMAMNREFFTAVDLMLSKYNVKDIDVTHNDQIIHFHIACIRNNVNLVKSFIACGMNVNTYVNNTCGNADVWSGYSPLHFAVENQSVDVVELLLSYGANYTFLNAKQLSPLHLAYYLENSVEKYKMLDYILFIHATNPANPVDSKGISHFYIACTRAGEETITNFVKSGVDINSTTKTGCYPLYYAVISGQKKTVEILLKHGAKVNLKVNYTTLLHIAIQKKSFMISKLLLTHGADVCATDSSDCTPIHKAYYDLCDSRDIFDLMMSVHQGKMMNVVDQYGLSIFHIACAVGDTTVVENFLKRDVNVNARLNGNSGEFSGFTALHFAAMNYHKDVIKLLLKYKVNVNALDKNGRSAIWLAVQFVVTESIVCKLNENLLKNKSSYEEAGVSEVEVMNFMRKEVKKIPIMMLLAENKSNLNRYNEKHTPLLFEAFSPSLIWKVKDKIANKNFIESICTKYNFACRKEIVKVLIENGIGFYVPDGNYNSILHAIAADSDNDENLEIAKMLLINGCNPNFNNSDGKTALHVAACNGSIKYVKLLLEHKVDPNSRDNRLYTPLHYAAQKSFIDDHDVETLHSKIMKLLIDNGANIEAKDRNGCTPLFATVHQRQSLRALLCLLKANCQVNICNSQRKSPLLIATTEKNAWGVKLLLDYGADINFSFKNSSLLKQMYATIGFTGFFHPSFTETFKVLEMHIEKLRLINYPVSVSNLVYRKYLGSMLDNRVFTNIIDLFAAAELAPLSDSTAAVDGSDFDLSEENNFITPALQDELEKMKDAKISNYTSLYDILFENKLQMVKHVKNPAFDEYLEETTLYTQFPHYGYILRLKYKQGMERYVLLEPAKESMKQLFGQHLPDLCFDGICIYLSDANLKNVIDAYV